MKALYLVVKLELASMRNCNGTSQDRFALLFIDRGFPVTIIHPNPDPIKRSESGLPSDLGLLSF